MSKGRHLGTLLWGSALILLAVALGLFWQLMPVRWSLAYWALVMIVLAGEVLARTVFKRHFAQHRALGIALDAVVILTLFVTSLLFVEHCYPGPS